MATQQNSDDKYRKKSRRLTEVQFELEDLRQRQEVIKAKHTKDIWTDDEFDKEKLRQAELTLRLEVDPEYQATRKRERELLLELGDLEYDLEEKFFEELPRRELPRYENDIDLDDR